MKYCQSCVGSSSGPPSGAVTPAFLAATRHVSITAALSSYGNRFGTSPEFSRLLMSSTYDSSLICESENKNTHGLPFAPASRQNRFRSSFHSTCVYDLEMAIWKHGMPMINDARRLNDCLPEPPTPTQSMCAPGCFNTRQMRATCSAAYKNIARFIGDLLMPLWSTRYSSNRATTLDISVSSSYSRSPPAASGSSSPSQSPYMQCRSSSASTDPSPSTSRCTKSSLKSTAKCVVVSSATYSRNHERSSSETSRS